MPDIDCDNLPPFPKRIPEKLKAIRERLALTPDEMAQRVGARNGAEIVAYENDEDDLLVSVLWGYVKAAGVPLENIFDDRCDLWFGYRQN
jgi:DNA-binding XRE family transcriptional regulator